LAFAGTVEFVYNNFSYKDSLLITMLFHQSWQNSYHLHALDFSYNNFGFVLHL